MQSPRRPRTLSTSHPWIWAAIVLSILICGAITWLNYEQRDTITQTERVLEEVRQARIDLAQGFLHVSLAGDPRAPFRRAEGLALINQAIAGLQQAETPGTEGSTTTEVARSAFALRSELAAWMHADAGKRPALELPLRLAFHRLERLADHLDITRQQELRKLVARSDRRFAWLLGVSATLLAGICSGVYVTGRNQRDAILALHRSEARLRLVGDNLPDSYVYQYRRDDHGQARFGYVSAGVARVHGVAADDVLRNATALTSQIDPGQLPSLVAAEAASARALRDLDLDLQFRRTDGQTRLLHLRSHPRRADDGRILWEGIAIDVTERRHAEEVLGEKDRLLHAMSAMAHIGAWAFDPATGAGDWTDEVARIHDMDPAAKTSRDLGLSVYHGESRAKIEQALQAAIKQGTPYDLELEMVTPAGNRKWVRTIGVPAVENGRVLRVSGTMQDITDRKVAELALRDSESRFRLLFEQAADGIFIYSADGRYEDVNSRGLHLLGYTRGELLGEQIGKAARPEDRDQLVALLARLRGGETILGEWRVRRKDGEDREIEVSGTRLSDGRALFIMRDSTERKRAESLTALQHSVTRVLADAAPLGQTASKIIAAICRMLHWEFGALWTVDPPAKKLRCLTLWHTPAAEFGALVQLTRELAFAPGAGLPGRIWSDRTPVWLSNVAHDDNFPRRGAAAALGLQDGIGFPVPLRGEVFGVFEFFSRQARQPEPLMLDLFGLLGSQIGQFIERQQLEEQVRQAQKMEAIGTLAGGIAHDFNNILAGILGYTTLAQMVAGGNRVLEDYLEQVTRAGNRAADLVRQILAFSRKKTQQRSVVQLHQVIAEPVKLLRATIPATVRFEVSLPSDLPPVMADATQVHQIMMNLGANAWHAMRVHPGVLEIRAETITVETAGLGAPVALSPGSYVRVAVRDTGHGMDAATRERIFEPFFTTKAAGEGTGLGLSVVHGIMRDHGGAIAVESEPGVGTTFHLYFPVDQATPPPADSVAPVLPRGKGERILVVDDEESVALSTQMLLETFGYAVETRTDPAAALAAMRQAP